MPDFNIRSDSVNVEQIMDEIRSRIREKRGVDYTEQQIRELAAVKLEKFLDPRGVRSDLLEQFRRSQPPPPPRPNYKFEEDTLFETHRGPIRFLRRLLKPLLKLLFNPNPLIQALHIQSQLNTIHAEREAARYELDRLHYEVMHNLVIETTRLGIEVKTLKMRLESIASRLEFNERRARALESVVVYKGPVSEIDESTAPPEPTPATGAPRQDRPAVAGAPEGPGQRSRRRRRRRGRRGGAPAAVVMGGGTPGTGGASPTDDDQGQDHDHEQGDSDGAEAREAMGGHEPVAESFEREMAEGAQPHETRGDAGSTDPHGSDSSGQ